MRQITTTELSIQDSVQQESDQLAIWLWILFWSIGLKIKAIVCVIIVAWNSVVNRQLATSCEILVASAKFLVALATRKAQFRTLNSIYLLTKRGPFCRPVIGPYANGMMMPWCYPIRVHVISATIVCSTIWLRLITLTETLIILDITKTESNNCFIIHWTKQKKTLMFVCFFTDGKQLDMITLRNHALQSCTTWLPVTLTWLLYNLQLWRHRRWFRKFTIRFRPIRKEIVNSMYNNKQLLDGDFVLLTFFWITFCEILK